MAAARTRPAGVPGRHGNELHALPGQFVAQLAAELIPALIEDGFIESELAGFDGEDDHVRLLVSYPPKVVMSALVSSLKGVSSRMIRKKKYISIRKKLWGGALWSPSYSASTCGGAPIATIRQYIEQQ